MLHMILYNSAILTSAFGYFLLYTVIVGQGLLVSSEKKTPQLFKAVFVVGISEALRGVNNVRFWARKEECTVIFLGF